MPSGINLFVTSGHTLVRGHLSVMSVAAGLPAGIPCNVTSEPTLVTNPISVICAFKDLLDAIRCNVIEGPTQERNHSAVSFAGSCLLALTNYSDIGAHTPGNMATINTNILIWQLLHLQFYQLAALVWDHQWLFSLHLLDHS